MLYQWYMSVVKQYHDIPLTGLQKEILVRCIEKNDKNHYPTVYDLKKMLEGSIRSSKGEVRPMLRYMDVPAREEVNYKLVHQAVKRLEAVGLIQTAIDGYLERGKIPYRLTELGVFYVFHHGMTHPAFFYVGKNDEDELPLTLKVLIQPFMEFSTVRFGTVVLNSYLAEYVQQCCNIVLMDMPEHYRKHPKMEDFWVQELAEKLNLTASTFALKIITDEPRLENSLGDEEIKAFIDDEIRRRRRTLELLAADKRFMSFLYVIHEDISKAYKKIMEMRMSQEK